MHSRTGFPPFGKTKFVPNSLEAVEIPDRPHEPQLPLVRRVPYNFYGAICLWGQNFVDMAGYLAAVRFIEDSCSLNGVLFYAPF